MSDEPPKSQEPLRWPDSFFGTFLWLLKILWGCGFTQGRTDDGLRESLTLLGFLLIWQAALLAYIQSHPIPEPRVVTVYVVISMLPLLGIFSICAVPRLKVYHRRISWRLGFTATLLVIGVAASYVRSMLPGQIQTGTYLDTGENLLAVNLEREDAPPDVTLSWTAELKERAAKYWTIESVLCFRDAQKIHPIEIFYDRTTRPPAPSLKGRFDGYAHRKFYFRVQLREIQAPDFPFGMEELTFVLDRKPNK